eukprot:3704361-Rhodomonas_salina.1
MSGTDMGFVMRCAVLRTGYARGDGTDICYAVQCPLLSSRMLLLPGSYHDGGRRDRVEGSSLPKVLRTCYALSGTETC